ncbi:MAG: alkaline phosphatase D family protein [Planctomycetota bacterium]
MSNVMTLGPILGYEAPGRYTVCLVIEKGVDAASLSLSVSKGKVAPVVTRWLPSGRLFCRFAVTLSAAERKAGGELTYGFRRGNKAVESPTTGETAWTFAVPKEGSEPRLAFASCNGFSSNADRLQQQRMYGEDSSAWGQWDELLEDHGRDPVHLLVLGGDQVYSDAILSGAGGTQEFGDWLDLSNSKRAKKGFTKSMRGQLERFFETIYLKQWAYEPVAKVMARVPSAMMWDDHDIIDGWGSYEKLGEMEVMQGLFEVARAMFDVFQLRVRSENTALIKPGAKHATWACRIGSHLVLALDNRSRRTVDRIMDKEQWDDLDAWLEAKVHRGVEDGIENLLVVSPVPVVYRQFGRAEVAFSLTEWLRKEDDPDSLEDDVRDHWQHSKHQKERIRLVMTLLDAIRKSRGMGRSGIRRAAILSGDVHVGGTGRIVRREDDNTIFQIISSGIVHPAPTATQWLGISSVSTTGDEEIEGGSVRLCLDRPLGSSSMFLRARNYATLKVRGDTPKLYVEWACENGERPSIAIPAR